MVDMIIIWVKWCPLVVVTWRPSLQLLLPDVGPRWIFKWLVDCHTCPPSDGESSVRSSRSAYGCPLVDALVSRDANSPVDNSVHMGPIVWLTILREKGVPLDLHICTTFNFVLVLVLLLNILPVFNMFICPVARIYSCLHTNTCGFLKNCVLRGTKLPVTPVGSSGQPRILLVFESWVRAPGGVDIWLYLQKEKKRRI